RNVSLIYRRTHLANDRKPLRFTDGASAVLLSRSRTVSAAGTALTMGFGVSRHVQRRSAAFTQRSDVRGRASVAAGAVCGRRAYVPEGHSLARQRGSRNPPGSSGTRGILRLSAVHSQYHARSDEAHGLR